jgi:4-amino-4-deoxy-L-arabinose transferase-like glycosyltransferase
MARSAKKSAGGDASAAEAPQRQGSWLWFLTLLLAGAFVAAGLIGHQPWTEGEAYSLGAVESILASGNYVVPQVDGEPALQSPPLYYITAAAVAQALADHLPAEQAARLATGAFLAITLLFTALFGRAAWRTGDDVPPLGTGAISVLVLIGTLGVVWFGHDMVADAGLIAGMAMALYGLALLPRKVLAGGFWLGTGAGVAFMSTGLFGPVVLLAAAVLMPIMALFNNLGRYLKGFLVAVAFALPWLVIWPWLLYQRDPQLYELWLFSNNIDRFRDGFTLGTAEEQLRWLWVFLVMAFPGWLLAALTLVLRPGALFGFSGVRAALIVTLAGWALVVTNQATSPIHGLALLVPIAVIAAGGIRRLPGLLIWPAHWLSALLFGVIAAALWGAWIWLLYQGEPPPLEGLGNYLPMDYGFQWQPAVYVTAAAATVIWLWVVMRFRPSRPAALLAWPTGVVMVWSLVALHQPWLDAAIEEGTLAKALPAELLPQLGPQPEPPDVAPAADTGVEAAAAPATSL